MAEKWKRLMHRYVDKTRGRENWVVRLFDRFYAEIWLRD